MYKLCLAPSDEGAVDCKLTVRQFTFYKSTEGWENYKLDVLIGYYLINLHDIIIPHKPKFVKLTHNNTKIKNNSNKELLVLINDLHYNTNRW